MGSYRWLGREGEMNAMCRIAAVSIYRGGRVEGRTDHKCSSRWTEGRATTDCHHTERGLNGMSRGSFTCQEERGCSHMHQHACAQSLGNPQRRHADPFFDCRTSNGNAREQRAYTNQNALHGGLINYAFLCHYEWRIPHHFPLARSVREAVNGAEHNSRQTHEPSSLA